MCVSVGVCFTIIEPLMENCLQWKTPLMEDNIRWKRTLGQTTPQKYSVEYISKQLNKEQKTKYGTGF